ncbi:MAG: hypothetical protein KDC92_14830 [Bacteroidetes bacterium]|nr:hypothetical protein [Bacteroidota bacterium]
MSNQKSKELVTKDFYFNEQGLMVFTEHYHLKRGYCCGSKCKHCPYNWEKVPKWLNNK